MPTSGVVTFSMGELEIITDALVSIGYLDPSETPTGSDLELARRKLNMIVKQWTAQLDFAPGLKMWTRRTAYLFLQDGQTKYSLGPSGDHATESFVETTLSAAAATSATDVELTAFAGMSDGDYIGILLDDGSIHWTTISGTPAATTTITTGLESGASSGNAVFTYTTKMRRPFELAAGVIRENGHDTPIDTSMTMEEYESIYSKSAEGTPSRLYFEAQRTNADVYLDCAPDDCTKYLRFRYLSYIEDFTDTTDDADFPAEWARALSAQLSLDLCVPYGRPVSESLKAVLQDSLSAARKAYPERTVLEFQNCPDDY